MAQSAPAVFKIPTKSPQPARSKPGRPVGRAKTRRPASGRVRASGAGRAATPGGGVVIELEYGITVYPAREEHGRWRAVWYEGASGSSARRRARRSWPPGWRTSPNGWQPTRRR